MIIKNILDFTCIILFVLVATGGVVYYHELSHQQIYKMWDIESEMHHDFKNMYSYVSVDAEDYYNKCNDACKIAQAQVEAKYQETPFYAAALLLLGFIAINKNGN